MARLPLAAGREQGLELSFTLIDDTSLRTWLA
jgi:hypothetical protein